MPPGSPTRFERHPKLTLLALLGTLLALAELGLRFAEPSVLRFAYAARQIHTYSSRWYVDLVPRKSVHLHLADAKGDNVYNFIVTTNAFGFRTHDREREGTVLEAHGSGSERFVHAVGDSYTMGWGVDHESSYPAQLDGLLPGDVRAVNLGADGYGTIAATEKSMELADRFPPLCAVYLFVPNDFDDDARVEQTRRQPWPYHLLLGTVDVLRRHSYLANVPHSILIRRRFAAGLRPVPPSPLKRNRPEPEACRAWLVAPDGSGGPATGGETSLQPLARYHDFLRARGARLIVFTLSRAPESQLVYRACMARGIAVRMIEPSPQMTLVGDGHFTAAGNECFARLVIEAMADHGLATAKVPPTNQGR